MGHRRDSAAKEQPPRPLSGQGLPTLVDEHDRTVPVPQLARRVKDLQRPTAQRHPMLAGGLHPACRNRPHARIPVDLAPHRPTDLAAPRRRQDQKLERERVDLPRLCRPHPRDGRRHLAVRQGLAVRDDIVLRAEHRQEPVARVVPPPVHGDSPFQHGADAQTDGAGDLRPPVPDRGERFQHVSAGDLRDRHLAEAREGIHFQRADPQPRGLRAPPSAALLLDHAHGGLGEGRNALGPALLGHWIAARAGQLPVRQCLLAGLC